MSGLLQPYCVQSLMHKPQSYMQAYKAEEVPVGAVMVYKGRIISTGRNTTEESGNPTLHAEMKVIQEAAKKVGRFKLPECALYVTLEPCPMCAGAILQARVGTLVYGAKNSLLGGCLLCFAGHASYSN